MIPSIHASTSCRWVTSTLVAENGMLWGLKCSSAAVSVLESTSAMQTVAPRLATNFAVANPIPGNRHLVFSLLYFKWKYLKAWSELRVTCNLIYGIHVESRQRVRRDYFLT